VEYGSPAIPPVHSYQLDRGRFENELAARNVEAGNTVLDGWKVEEIELDGEHKRVTIRARRADVRADEAAGSSTRPDARGCSSASSGLAREVGHHINSAWFRLAGGLDIDEWSDDEQWHRRMRPRAAQAQHQPPLRQRATGCG
jgi:flavin-dependent dehydrogenase